jgi:hypothetical protein
LLHPVGVIDCGVRTAVERNAFGEQPAAGDRRFLRPESQTFDVAKRTKPGNSGYEVDFRE